MFSDNVCAKLKADDEHVESQAELGGREEIARSIAFGLFRVPREQRRLYFGGQVPEEAWAKHYAGDHFRDDLGLPESFCDSADDAADPEDDRDLEEKLDGEV